MIFTIEAQAAQRGVDLVGRRFGRVLVEARDGHIGTKTRRIRWRCLCDCGGVTYASSASLKRGSVRSCGCLQREVAGAMLRRHGEAGPQGRSGTPRYELWRGARGRARDLGLPFDLCLDDIVIPETCPVLGVSLEPSLGKATVRSPSLDRIVPKLGYVRGNVRVISHRANMLKSDASIEELEAVLNYLREVLS